MTNTFIARNEKAKATRWRGDKNIEEVAHRLWFKVGLYKFHCYDMTIDQAISLQQNLRNAVVTEKNLKVIMDEEYYRIEFIVKNVTFSSAKLTLEQMLETRRRLLN